ncbi:MAG: aldo/keto reductase, partial [Candidatus Aenigmatarchaeota archaeon]
MIYRKLGRTDLDVSLISLGGGVFNRNKDPLEKTSEAINFAVENGINLIDIGKEYDEEFIGKAMGNNKKKIHIVARSEAKDGENLLNDIKDSINKLGVKPIPIYEVWKCNENILEALKKAKRMGLIKCAGIFNHRIDVVEKAIKTGEFEVTTILYNLVHRMAEKIFPLA